MTTRTATSNNDVNNKDTRFSEAQTPGVLAALMQRQRRYERRRDHNDDHDDDDEDDDDDDDDDDDVKGELLILCSACKDVTS